MVPALPFSSVQIDLCGPFKTKQKKVYLLLYICIFSKALGLEIVENYSSQAVITGLQKHFSRRNLPHTICSDRGSQLVKAREIISTDCHKSNNEGLSRAQTSALETKYPQITWNLVPPGAHHRVGSVESMVKLVKRSLRYLSISHLNIFEFDLIVQNIAAIVNNRPLGFNVSSEDIICPNQLLLGRAYSDCLPPDINEPGNIVIMRENTKAIVKSWFERWNLNVLPRLFGSGNRPNFKEDKNLQPGDICLLHQKKGKHSVIGYKYCKVIETVPSRDKLIRTVKVAYFNYPSKVRKSVLVDVRRLSLIQPLSDQTPSPDHTDNYKSAIVINLMTETCTSNTSIMLNTKEAPNSTGANSTSSDLIRPEPLQPSDFPPQVSTSTIMAPDSTDPKVSSEALNSTN